MKNKKSRGQTFVENCIIWGLVCVVAIGILTTFGGTVTDILFKSKEQVRGFQPFGVPTNAKVMGNSSIGDNSAMNGDSDGLGLGDGEILDDNSDVNDFGVTNIDVNEFDINDIGDEGGIGISGNEAVGMED